MTSRVGRIWRVAFALALAPLFGSPGVLRATVIFDLQDVNSRVYAQAAAAAIIPPDTAPIFDSEERTAGGGTVSASASIGGYSSFASASGGSSITNSGTVLQLSGRGQAQGTTGMTGGATGNGSSSFSAYQFFGELTWVHLRGGMSRSGVNPNGSAAISFSMGSYSQFLLGGTFGSHGFDDYVQFFGNVPISASLSESQPSVPVGGASGISTFGATIHILADESGATQDLPILPSGRNVEGAFTFSAGTGPGRWFDPPTTYGFDYETSPGGAPFTVVGLPVGLEPEGDGLYTISGAFGSVTLPEGAYYDFVTPVTSFSITGFDGGGNGESPVEFPVYLAFLDDGLASFTMTPLLQDLSATVPEPGAFSTLALAALALLGVRRRAPLLRSAASRARIAS